MDDFRLLANVKIGPHPIRCAAFSKGGIYFATAGDNIVRLWYVVEAQCKGLTLHSGLRTLILQSQSWLRN